MVAEREEDERAVAIVHVEVEHVGVERDRTLDVADLEMNVAGMGRRATHVCSWCEEKLSALPPSIDGIESSQVCSERRYRLVGCRSLVAVPIGRRGEAEFVLFAAPSPLARGDRLGIGGGVVAESCPRVVDFRVTPPTEEDRDLVARLVV